MLLFAALFAIIGSSRASSVDVVRPTCAGVDDRVDCGYFGIQEPECSSKGCCWAPADQQPWCFYPVSTDNYIVTSQSSSTTGSLTVLHLGLIRPCLPQYGPDFKELHAALEYQTPQRLHIKIAPAASQRWEVPEDLIPRPGAVPFDPSQALYQLQPWKTGGRFKLQVARRDGNGSMFDSGGSRLVFKDQYLELSTTLNPDATLYGLGERVPRSGALALQRGGPGGAASVYTLWNADTAAYETDKNLYGSHPFYLQVEADGSSHGVLLLNSNGMDVLLTPSRLTFKVIGGLLDLYIFAGPTPLDVLRQYQEVVGRPAMPPLWALGFHNCRWGYHDVGQLAGALEGYRLAGIPLDVIWTDIDYMDRYRDFTFDPTNFNAASMRAFTDSLHASGLRWVPIIDCGIPDVPDDPAHKEGVAAGVFLKDRTGQLYLGQVWPGPTHYPDFFNNATLAWWAMQLQRMHAQVPFDGIWIDMNEASNFCPGEVCSYRSAHGTPAWRAAAIAALHGRLPNAAQRRLLRRGPATAATLADDPTACRLACEQPAPGDRLAYPPYSINNQGAHAALGSKALPLTAVHASGARQYDTHNLYGLSEARATALALTGITGKRPFLLSRSTFSGSGRYGAHWSGDNRASWDDLRWSVSSLLNGHLWGMPLVGADICGFDQDTNEELCARWAAAGAFYTFSRVHNTRYAQPQELWRWPRVADAARRALGLRYQLLPYLYTGAYLAAVHGGALAQPLFFPFPWDQAARDVSGQWLLGDAVLVSPVLQPGVDHVTAYLPGPATWYDLWEAAAPLQPPSGADDDERPPLICGPTWVRLAAPIDHVPLHVRGGAILPLQRPGSTTGAVRASPLTLLVALPAAGGAGAHAGCGGAGGGRRRSAPAAAGVGAAAGMGAPQRQAHPPLAGYQLYRGAQRRAKQLLGGACARGALLACGALYLDDGESLQVGGSGSALLHLTAIAAPNTSTGWLQAEPVGPVQAGGAPGQGVGSGSGRGVPLSMVPVVEAVRLLGVWVDAAATARLEVRVDGVAVAAASVVYDAVAGRLHVGGLQGDLQAGMKLDWRLLPLVHSNS